MAMRRLFLSIVIGVASTSCFSSFENGQRELSAWNFTAAISELTAALQQKDVRAASLLAKIHLRGFRLVPKDTVALLDALEIAARSGSADAKGELGRALTGNWQSHTRTIWPRYEALQPNAIGFLSDACYGGYSHSCRVLAELSASDKAESERWARKQVEIQLGYVKKGDIRWLNALASSPGVFSPEWIKMRAMYHALDMMVGGEPVEQNPTVGPISEADWRDAIEQARVVARQYQLIPTSIDAAVPVRVAEALLKDVEIDREIRDQAVIQVACAIFQFLSPSVVASAGWQRLFEEARAALRPVLEEHFSQREKILAASRDARRDWLVTRLKAKFSDVQVFRLAQYLAASPESRRQAFRREVMLAATSGVVALTRLKYDPTFGPTAKDFREKLGAYARSLGVEERLKNESGARDRLATLLGQLSTIELWGARSLEQQMVTEATLQLSDRYETLSKFFGPLDDSPHIGVQTRRRLYETRAELGDYQASIPEMKALQERLFKNIDQTVLKIGSRE